MRLETLFSAFPSDAIGTGLIHFTWQASVIALLSASLMVLCRNLTSQARYRLCCLGLVLMLVLPCATVLVGPRGAGDPMLALSSAPASATEAKDISIGGKFIGTQFRQSGMRLAERGAALDRSMPYVTSAWLICVVLISMYHLIGFLRLQRLVQRTRQLVEPLWEARLQRLARLLRVKSSVRAFTSAGIATPAVIGCFKPILLLPVAFFTGMDAAYVEAIMIHELAHIKRYDYLINLLQMGVEILGFFHPAVWWLSRQIRKEREHCCDDVAVNATGDGVTYAKSLLYLEERRLTPSFAVAANGGDLLRRVSRVLGRSQERHSASFRNVGGPVVAGLCMIMLMGFSWMHGSVGLRSAQTTEESERIVRGCAPHLAAFYPCSGDANAASGFHQDGTIHNASLSEDRCGRKDCAFDFDGTSSYLSATMTRPLTSRGSITVACWICPRRCGQYESWVSRPNGKRCTSQWRTGFGEAKNTEWGFTECCLGSDGDLWTDYWATHSEIPLHQWTHVAAVADGPRGVVFLYVNGRLIAQMDNLRPLTDESTPLLIGFQKDDRAFFDGKIDDIRIYDCALSSREVLAVSNVN